MKRKNGFTLLELLLYLAIVSMLFMYLAPPMSSLKDETRETNVTNNKSLLEGFTEQALSRLKAKGLAEDILLTELIKELETTDMIKTLENPFDTSKTGIALIKGDTYDNTNKAAYIFTSPPKENTLPKGTIYYTITEDRLLAEGSPDIGIDTVIPPTDQSSNLKFPYRYSKVSKRKMAIAFPLNGLQYKVKGTNSYDVYNHKSSSPLLPNVLDNSSVKSFSTNNEDYFVELTSGKVMYSGIDSYGESGLGLNAQKAINNPVEVPILQSITELHQGIDFTIIKDTNNKWWGFGTNTKHQLGFSPNNAANFNPTLLDIPNNVIEMSVGGSHTIYLRSDNTLWGFGDNEYNQLGITGKTLVETPTKIDTSSLSSPIKSIYAGINSSAIVCTDGSIYIFGAYIGETKGTLRKIIDKETPIIDMALGNRTVIIVKNNGIPYFMGLNDIGQSGTLSSENYITTLTQMRYTDDATNKIIEVYANSNVYALISSNNSIPHIPQAKNYGYSKSPLTTDSVDIAIPSEFYR